MPPMCGSRRRGKAAAPLVTERLECVPNVSEGRDVDRLRGLGEAVERAGAKAGNKGWDAALSAIEMVSLRRALEKAGF